MVRLQPDNEDVVDFIENGSAGEERNQDEDSPRDQIFNTVTWYFHS